MQKTLNENLYPNAAANWKHFLQEKESKCNRCGIPIVFLTEDPYLFYIYGAPATYNMGLFTKPKAIPLEARASRDGNVSIYDYYSSTVNYGRTKPPLYYYRMQFGYALEHLRRARIPLFKTHFYAECKGRK